MKKILLTLLALTLSLTVLAGCTVSSIDDEIHENTEKDVIEETSGENTENKNNGVPQGITVNKIEFNTITEMSDLPESVLNAIDAGKEKRGYTYFEYEDGFMLVVFMGEKNTGGYGIEVVSVEDNEGRTNVVVKETTPAKDAMVIQVITYPYTVVTMKGVTDNFNIVNEDNEPFELIEIGETE
ncbi:MAG TPA: hypothetical protein DDZ89_21410 [Clostridiales bacterium]|nr:hypothetical protein [Clostridiales bacterium]